MAIKIDSHPVTGEPVVRASWFARFFGAQFFTKRDLLDIALSHRPPGEGYPIGRTPPDDWYQQGLDAINSELQRRRAENPPKLSGFRRAP